LGCLHLGVLRGELDWRLSARPAAAGGEVSRDRSLTPPVGFNVYVIKSVIGDAIALETIFRGVLWCLACEVVAVALLIAFPEIALFLPGPM